MLEPAFQSAIRSLLLRTVEFRPETSMEHAISQLEEVLSSQNSDLLNQESLNKILEQSAAHFSQYGVLNPHWLVSQGLQLHFFLVDARPGWLEDLVSQLGEQREGISQYILYGDADSLLILYGTDEEARIVNDKIQQSNHHKPVHFTARSIPLFYRYKPMPLEPNRGEAKVEDVNEAALHYSQVHNTATAKRLLEQRVILGPVWLPNEFSRERVTAFVGIRVAGRFEVSPGDVLRTLEDQPSLRSSLVHLFETDRGQPFHYFAKLVCRDMEELDEATNQISYARIGRGVLEGVTFVVADGVDQIPVCRSLTPSEIATSPVSLDLDTAFTTTFVRLGRDVIPAFNDLPTAYRLVVLRSLTELDDQLSRRKWSDEVDQNLAGAVRTFGRASVRGPQDPGITGAVAVLAQIVEATLQGAIRRIAESRYGDDSKRAQNELRLPTRKYEAMSLGKSAVALKTVKGHEDFEFLSRVLLDEWLERLTTFAAARNKWVHGSLPRSFTGEKKLDEARRVIVEGIELVRWVNESVIPQLEEAPTTSQNRAISELQDPPDDRKFGVFLSHSSQDKRDAERIANYLRDLGYPIWYDKWSIYPGESIVDRIHDGLSRNDTLLILLSPHSVASSWVRKELNSALMDQLSGQNVKVIPVLIAACDVPGKLRDIKYIDLTSNFQEGFVELLRVLNNLRAAAEGS